MIPGWKQIVYDDLQINGRPDAAGWTFFLFRHRITGEEAATADVWDGADPGPLELDRVVVGGPVKHPEEVVFGSRGSTFSNTGTFTFNAHNPTPTPGCMVARIMAARPTATMGTLPAPLVDLAETCSSPDWGFRQWLAFDGGTTTPTEYANGMIPTIPDGTVDRGVVGDNVHRVRGVFGHVDPRPLLHPGVVPVRGSVGEPVGGPVCGGPLR